jgi:hypothetical protein
MLVASTLSLLCIRWLKYRGGAADTDLELARDALVLKALTPALSQHVPASPRRTHLNGHGGAKFAVREVRDHLVANRFALRTDVKSHYASIDHLLLLDKLAVHIRDRRRCGTARPALPPWRPSRKCILTAGRKTGTIHPFPVVVASGFPSGRGPGEAFLRGRA